ncbi:hypothetical protein GWI33_012490 [Rhynchophorus ferrugineus]|uniref:RING-type domain-containing protein n=1 Tax=Rhynchophorus ferrugineus TaxID=354439 RepID=A0A834M8Q6_RHYFE|nr:hypothetical protein GWI33_012490 [Rhynchophorus ferrugineus]
MRMSSQWIRLEYEELLARANSVTFNGNSFLRDMNVDYMEISEDNEDFSLVMSDRLKTLETVLFDSSSSAGQTTCVICLDDFKERETIKKLPCHHSFHISCIDHWLKIKITCPLCRSGMTH